MLNYILMVIELVHLHVCNTSFLSKNFIQSIFIQPNNCNKTLKVHDNKHVVHTCTCTES